MSGRFLNLALAFGLLLAIGLTSVSTGSYAQTEPKNLHVDGYVQLIRADPNTNRPLFRFTIKINDEAGNDVEIPSQGALQKQLQIFQTNPPRQAPYEPFYISASQVAGESVMPRYALVVFDISGSMNDKMGSDKTKFEAAKNAAEKVLGYFEPGIDHVAIVPFESHNVTVGIQEASFVSESKLAIGQLKNLPLPKSGNTGLFSAVLAGLEVLSKQDSRAARILIAMTDGQNDVNKLKRDDRDLIEGKDVPEQLVDRIRAKQLPVYTIGFGKSTDINEDAMRKLAAPNESNYIPAQDEKELERAFKKIRSGMVKNIQAVIKPDETMFDDLNGADRIFKVQINTTSPALTSLDPSPFIYRPPLTGSVATSNSATPEELEAFAKIQLPGGEPDKNPFPPYAILLIFAALIAMLWFVLPRFIWPEYAAAGPKTAPSPAARRPMPNQQTGGYTAGGWRTQSGQTGRTMGGRLGGSPKTNVGPDRTSSGPKQ